MHSTVVDVLSRVPPIEGTEVELRFPVPAGYFETIREQFALGREEQYTISVLAYADATDLRCLDGCWQRKRTCRYRQLKTPMPCKLCVAVESPAAAPPDVSRYRMIERRRWTYHIGQWRVDWTSSSRACNVELEFDGVLADLLQSARKHDDLLGLVAAADALMPYLVSLSYGRVLNACGGSRTLPFVQHGSHEQPLALDKRALYRRYAAINQPVSLFQSSLGMGRPLVSLKYDGQRIILVLQKRHGLSAAWGLCRRDLLWCIPCQHTPCEMVLDCELLVEARKLVVFDMYQYAGVPCSGDYTQRLQELSGIELPTLLGYDIVRKEFYPPSVVSESWYAQLALGSTDGLIVHDGIGYLGSRSLMYKWKPVHTVDLLVGPRGELRDASHTQFLPCASDQGPWRKGEIWECAFESDGNRVRPIKQRIDKTRPNPRAVCQEIRKAHNLQVTVADLAVLLRANVPDARRATCGKRARGI